MTTGTTDRPAEAGTDAIAVRVPAELARKYREAPAETRRAWDLMLELHLRNLIDPPRRPLEEVMADLGRTAAANGLTEDELNDILREWDEERKAARGATLADPGPGR